jgi:hypothetical protein
MKEVEPDNKWVEDTPEEFGVSQELMSTGPSDAELLSITILARLYDIGMAILTHLDEETAGKVFEAHEKGENFNPPMYIPDLTVRDE